VGLLLATQQDLINLRIRRERERRVLEGIVRFSEQVLPAETSGAFWSAVVDATTSTFDCETSLALHVGGGGTHLLAGRGPQPLPGDEFGRLVSLLHDCGGESGDCSGQAATDMQLTSLRFRGGPVAALLWAPMGRDAAGGQQVLAIALTARKRAFFPALTEEDLPALRLFASHVSVLHEMLRSHELIARQVAELDRSNAALEQRMVEEQRAAEERERLRAQLAAARRMESIGRLAGGVAHDFNNLLMVINGNAGLLQMDPELGADARPLVGEVVEAANRASALTQQLLMFSRKQLIRPTPVDFNTLLSAKLRMYRRLIGEDIHLSFTPCLDDTPVLADPQQFDQLIGNLLANARDAIHAVPVDTREARIHVRTRLALDDSPLPGRTPCVCLEVKDLGLGMDESVRQNIFEPFFTTKTIGHGSGLGLATVLGVIEQNHGHIEVRSTLGQGSTFLVFWPLLGGETPPPRERRDEVKHHPDAPSVWLVEDEDQVRRFMVRGLERLGFSVTAFATGQSLLQTLDLGTAPPAILVTDVVMPQMNGRQLAEAVASRLPDLPVLFVSGYTDDIIAQHGVLRGGVALLEKPFTPAELGQKIEDILAASSSAASASPD
jgi:signal transduction histidine kinase/ActR/RegA family two-component response regulator